jgi:hypothetical protein
VDVEADILLDLARLRRSLAIVRDDKGEMKDALRRPNSSTSMAGK